MNNLKKFLILVVAVITRFLVIKLKSKPSIIRTVVIVQQAKLGDMVCTTPMFIAVKEKYPEVKLIVVGNTTNRELLEGHPLVDEYLVFDSIWSLAKKLRIRKVDFGCTPGPNFGGLAAMSLGLVPFIVAPVVTGRASPYENIFYRTLRLLVATKEHYFYGYAPREYLKLLEVINIFTSNTTKILTYSEKAEKKISQFLNGLIKHGDVLIAISPSAGNKIKNWGSNKFASLVSSFLTVSNVKIFLIGAEKDEKEVKQLLIGLGNDRQSVVNTAGSFNIDELKCFISKMNLFISVDTGPIYIAEAFGVPTVDIVGPVDERVQPPRGENHKIIIPRRSQAELFVMDSRSFDSVEAERQSKNSSVQEVLDMVKSMRIKNLLF